MDLTGPNLIKMDQMDQIGPMRLKWTKIDRSGCSLSLFLEIDENKIWFSK